jgi:hypothetical protein
VIEFKIGTGIRTLTIIAILVNSIYKFGEYHGIAKWGIICNNKP